MSAEILEKAGFEHVHYGRELYSSGKTLMHFQQEFENSEGHVLRLEILGSPERAEEFLASLQFAFRVELLEGEVAPIKEELVALEEELIATIKKHAIATKKFVAEETALGASDSLQVHWSFPYEEQPFRWEIEIDPTISDIAAAHNYTTASASKITATLTVVSGKLTMSVDGVVSVDSATSSRGAIGYSALTSRQFKISVDGLDPSNEYSLNVVGATHWRV